MKYQLNYHATIPEFVNSDEARVRQIIMNLLSNAIKYSSPKGQIMITCSHSMKNSVFIIGAKDNGLGIKPQDFIQLFKEFVRVEDKENSTKNPNGIGLDLIISNELSKLLSINSLGISVESQYQQGSTFSFEILNQKISDEDLSDSQVSDGAAQMISHLPETHFFQQLILISNLKSFESQLLNNYHLIVIKWFQLPINTEYEKSLQRKSTTQSNQIMEQANNWSDQTSKQPPVLIVDDNEFNIIVLQYLLEQLKLFCDSAISGQIALKKCEERAFIQNKLIFLDIEMPVMDGLETAKKLLQLIQAQRLLLIQAIDKQKQNWRLINKQESKEPQRNLCIKEIYENYS